MLDSFLLTHHHDISTWFVVLIVATSTAVESRARAHLAPTRVNNGRRERVSSVVASSYFKGGDG